MVGPGTGIAPMRAFLQERSYQKHQKDMMVGDSVLYFGCRRRDSDYLYEEELKQFQEQGVLTHLHVAFSREEHHKVYVQHLIADHAKETWDLIDRQQASIYVCGGTKMGLDVTETITKVIADVGGKGMDGAKAYVERLRSEGRFVQELWA
jgi:NADPH-ferrihemoprotein reductase